MRQTVIKIFVTLSEYLSKIIQKKYRNAWQTFQKRQVLLEKRNSADLDGSAMKRDAKRDAPWPTKTLNYAPRISMRGSVHPSIHPSVHNVFFHILEKECF